MKYDKNFKEALDMLMNVVAKPLCGSQDSHQHSVLQ